MMPYPLFFTRRSTKGSASHLLRFEPTPVGWVSTQKPRLVGLKPDLQSMRPKPVGWVSTQHATSLRAIATQSSPSLGITPDCRGLRPRNDRLIFDRPRNDTLIINRPRSDVFSIYRPRNDRSVVGWVSTQHATSLRAIATQSSPSLGITPDCRGLRPRNDNLFIDRPRNDTLIINRPRSDVFSIYHPRNDKPNLQKGFTLLEMVLVLFLVGLMASATLMLTEGVEDQAKYDETKRRMDIMRKAIVGDPTRTVNGSPEISGFVADMGRLPECVRELLEPLQCDATPLGAWSIDASTGIGFGWRGPYIAVSPERNGDRRLRDGYANSDASDALNSGWLYSADASNGIVSVSSDGFDITNSVDDITHDSLVIADDWRINSINVNFISQNASDALPATDVDLNLRVYLSDTTNYVTGDDNINTALTISSSAIPVSGEDNYLFHFDSSNAIPIGARGYAIVCYEKPAGDPNNYVVFDGDCNDASNAAPSSNEIKSFTVAPRQNITLNWVIK